MLDLKYVEGWRRRFAAQQAENQALAEAARRALPQALEILKKYGAKRIILFGSLQRGERFHRRSDIDLAVSGIPFKNFLRAGADLMMALDWPVDLKPFEELDEPFRALIVANGEILY